MAAVAEGAPAVEVSSDAPDGGQAAEDVKKTIISLSELVDLALCTPEPGAVNFNLLRAVLHALVQRLDLVDIKAEILDEDTDNVFSQIMENADKLGLKDLRARQTDSVGTTDTERRESRGESRERRHKSRRSDRSRGGSSRRASSERAASRSGPQEEQPGAGAGAEAGAGAGAGAGTGAGTGSGVLAAGGVGRTEGTRQDEPGTVTAADAPSAGERRKSRVGAGSGVAVGGGGGSSGSGGEHSDEFEDVREGFCPPDSAGHPDVARSRSLSGQRVSPREEVVPGEPAVTQRRPSSSGDARRTASADRAEDRTAEGSGSERPGSHRRSSTDSIGLSSDTESRGGAGSRQAGRKATLSELASERLRRSGRQSAVSIGSNIEGTAVLSDYTNLDRLERKMADIQQKMEMLEMADMLPKVRELQTAITGSQEDVQGLWQSLQLMKKVDANEEGIDKLTSVIETVMSKLKKVRKHTDRLDKQLADMMGQKSSQPRDTTDERKPVTLADMETKYNEIRSVIDGLMSSLGQEPSTGGGAPPEPTAQQLRSVGAGIVTWGVLESALENIRGEVKEMSEVNDQALTTVEETQTEARQQELRESAADDHASKVKQLLANLSRLVDKHRALEKRVLQMEESMGENFSDKVLEQLTLLKASASQIQDLRNKLGGGGRQSAPAAGIIGGVGGPRGGEVGPGWSDLDVTQPEGAGSMGHMVSDDLSLNLTSLREPSLMDLNHLSDWLNYNKARMEQLEKALVSQSEQVRDFGDRLGDQVVSFRDKLERVERELAGMLGRITATAQKSGMSREDSQALHDAYARIQTLQMDVEALSAVSKKIVTDRGQIDDELAMLIRALEELKECKVDRATLDELIETKADRSSVEKKVSSWQFEQACQELSEGLGSMLDKMGSQEVDWARSVDEINADLHRKLDRVELAPLRRYVNSRLKNIMGKLNKLIAEDESPDACTTRRKIIRNLNCLSCDDPKKITGLTAAPIVPLMEPFPAGVGDRPQISYRLGNIRRLQQMRCEPYKDLTGHQGVFRNHIRQEMDIMTHRGIPHHPNCPLYQNRAPHGRCSCVATRFCGGSHTKISCVDTRQRRIGLGAPLLPFGAARESREFPGRPGREGMARVSSAGGQRAAPSPGAGGGPRRPGSRAAFRPASSAGVGPRQVRSTGSGVRQKRGPATGGRMATKSAPEFAVPFEPPTTKDETGAGTKTETGEGTTAGSTGEGTGVEVKQEQDSAPEDNAPAEMTAAAASEEAAPADSPATATEERPAPETTGDSAAPDETRAGGGVPQETAETEADGPELQAGQAGTLGQSAGAAVDPAEGVAEEADS